MAAIKDLTLEQGKTFQHVLRWEAPLFIYKPITNITQEAPAVVTAIGHGVPDGWRVAIVSVKGMTQINAPSNALKDSDYRKATKLTDDTLELNAVNASEYSAYLSGGYVQYQTPVDLTGFIGRMKIKNREGVLLASTEVEDAPLNIITVTTDNALKTITVVISATDTAAFTWTKALYELEMVSGTGVVTSVMSGKLLVTKEIATG